MMQNILLKNLVIIMQPLDDTTISESDLYSLLKSPKFDLTKPVSRRISALQVIAEKPHKNRFTLVTISPRSKNIEVLQILLDSFCSNEYVLQIGLSEKNTRRRAIVNFINFVESTLGEKIGLNESVLKPLIIDGWQEHLKKTQSTYMAWSLMASVLKVLSRTLEESFGKSINWPTNASAIWGRLKRVTPPKPLHKKTLPIGMHLGISSDKFSNKELLLGLKYGVMWLLNKISEFRSALVQDSDIEQVKNLFKKLKASDLKIFPAKVEKEKTNDFATKIYKIILSDPLLSEWQFYSHTKLRKALETDIKLRYRGNHHLLFIRRYFNETRNVNAGTRLHSREKPDTEWLQHFGSVLGKTYENHKYIPCIWGADLIAHSSLERILMVWLLSAERIQTSGIKKLKLNNAIYSGNFNKQLQLTSSKPRRFPNSVRVTDNQISSPIYRQNSPIFETLDRWIIQEKKSQKQVHEYNKTNSFISLRSFEITGEIIRQNSDDIVSSYLPLRLLMIEGSEWQKQFISDSGKNAQREALAFIEIIIKIRNKRKTKKKISFPPSCIGQSVIVEKALGNERAQSTVESETSGHSLATNRNIYIDRMVQAGVKELIEPLHHFARTIGDEKFAMATQISEHFKSISKKISLEDLEKLCGIKTSKTKIKAMLEQLDEQSKITLAGEIIDNGNLKIVETDMTAALMWGYIKHIESSLDELLLSTREDASLRYIGKLIYLHHTFSRFDETIQYDGKILAKELSFPFPPLL